MTTKNLPSRPKTIKTCSVAGCVGEYDGLGFCQKHRQRFRKHGDPLVQTLSHGEGNTPEQRFWSRASLTANPDRCWNWQRSFDTSGYGNVNLTLKSGKISGAHRLAFYYFYDIHPGNNCVLHRCDNPKCVNPHHLFLGTRADNNADKIAKGRARICVGENVYCSQLSNQQVRESRQLLSQGVKPTEVAKIFGVKPDTIWRLRVGKTYRSVK